MFLHTYNLTHANNVRAGEHEVELEAGAHTRPLFSST